MPSAIQKPSFLNQSRGEKVPAISEEKEVSESTTQRPETRNLQGENPKFRKQEKKVRKAVQTEAWTFTVVQSCRGDEDRIALNTVNADRRSIRRLDCHRDPPPPLKVASKVADKEKKVKEKKEKLAKAQAGYNKVMSPS